jgi:uncharacterized protein YukE
MRSFPALGFDPAEGDQDAVQTVLLRIATACETITATLPRLEEACKITDDADWGGSAAEEFSDHGDDLPQALGKGAESMTAVSDALSGWLGTLTANQREADVLEADAKRAKDRLASAEAALNRVRDCTEPDYQAKLTAFTDAKDALRRLIDKANRLKARHLRAATATAEAIRSGPDDAFEPENDTWYVQAFDGIAVAADGVSLATGTVAAVLAAAAPETLGGSLIPAAAFEGVSTLSGAVGSGAALAQQLSHSRNAPGWLAVALGGLSVVPGGGTAAAGIRNGTKLAVRAAGGKALKRASRQAVKELRESLTSGGLPKVVKDLGEIRDKGLRRTVAADLKDAGTAEAKRLGVRTRDLSAAELRELGLRAKQAEAYANLVDKGEQIAEKAGVDLTPGQRRELKLLQLGLNPTGGQVDKSIEDIAKNTAQGK